MPNENAIRLEGGAVLFGRCEAIERANVTVEFFFRPYEKAYRGATVVGLATGDGDALQLDISQNRNPWLFAYVPVSNGEYAWLKLYCSYTDTDGLAKTAEIPVSPRYATVETGSLPYWFTAAFDGKWHHVALTLEELSETGKTRITTYWDKVQAQQVEIDGAIDFSAASRLMLGGGGRLGFATFELDEVRISDGILAPAQFLAKGKRLGTLFLIR